MPVFVRMAFFVELLLSLLLGYIAGWSGSCTAAAVVTMVASALFLPYALFIRPYDRRIDTLMSCTFAVLQFAQSVFAVVVTQAGDSGSELAMKTFAWITASVNAMFFVQLVIAVAWRCVVTQRNLAMQRRTAASNSSNSTSANSMPLLTIPLEENRRESVLL